MNSKRSKISAEADPYNEERLYTEPPIAVGPRASFLGQRSPNMSSSIPKAT